MRHWRSDREKTKKIISKYTVITSNKVLDGMNDLILDAI